MQVFLKIIGGKNDGRKVKISVPEFIIGRGDTAHLRPSSDLVSRRHCGIRVDDGKVIVEDFKSRNGSFVNGKAISKPHVARSGDRIRVGRLQFELVIDPVKAGDKKPKVTDVVEAASRTVAAKKSASLEDSITDWLSDDSDGSSAAPKEDEFDFDKMETVNFSAEETQEFRHAVENGSLDESGEIMDREDSAGKLPKVPKMSHADSTDAAGNILKQFFNRR